MKFLVVVDMQKDFIEGSLGTEQARSIVLNVVNKVNSARENGDIIFYTLDTHDSTEYPGTIEGKNLPVPHCVEDTDGWTMNKLVWLAIAANSLEKVYYVQKDSFGSQELNDKIVRAILSWGVPEEIEFVGLCTDFCVISNAIIAQSGFPTIPISVDAACLAGSTPEKHDMALAVMKNMFIKINNENKEPWRI